MENILLVDPQNIWLSRIQSILSEYGYDHCVRHHTDFDALSKNLIKAQLLGEFCEVIIAVCDSRQCLENIRKASSFTPSSQIVLLVSSGEQDFLDEKAQQDYFCLPDGTCDQLIGHLLYRSVQLAKSSRFVKQHQKSLEDRIAERTRDLDQMNGSLEKISHDRQNLIRILCHDLNNTISVLKFWSDKHYKISEPESLMQKAWGKMQTVVKKQEELVAFVRELDAVHSGKVEPQHKEVQLSTVFEQVEFLFEEKLSEKGVQINFDIEDHLVVYVDPLIMSHTIINNLISNAIKFSKKDSAILVKAFRQEDKVHIQVQDHGIGMPRDLLENIFSVHVKTSRVGTEGEVGTGFGMPLVKNYVEMFGGRISVTSRDIEEHPHDHGTCFHIVLDATI